MKNFGMALICACAGILTFVRPVVSLKTVRQTATADAKANSAISDIVKGLKEMQEHSEKDGEAESDTFEKFSCHNKKVISNKTTWIETMTDEIETADIKIERDVAKLSELKSTKAQLVQDIVDNKATQKETTAVRNKSRAAFVVEEASMKNALGNLSSAFTALSSNSTSLLQLVESPNSLPASVADQLLAMSQATQAKQVQGAVMLDIGSPPGEYTSQSTGVLGVLEKTRDSYAANLKELQDQEAKDTTAYDKMMKNMQDKAEQLKEMKTTADDDIEDTLGDLKKERQFAKDANANLVSQKSLKANLEKVLADKTKTYEDRKLLRTQEDSAISKAISILNSDSAFESFNKASVPDSFLQLTTSTGAELMQRRLQVLSFIRSQAHSSHSSRLARLAVRMSAEQTENPFDKVMEEIISMKAVIDKEEGVDNKKFGSCKKGRSDNKAAIEEQDNAINSQNKKITGNKQSKRESTKSKSEASEELKMSIANQEAATTSRAKENQDYQQNIADLQIAQNLVKHAIETLKTYYDKISFVQEQRNGATAVAEPTYDEGAYAGQSKKGGSVMTLMQTMLKSVEESETEAHKTEHTAQAAFEDLMAKETTNEALQKKTIQDLKKSLAETSLSLDESEAALADASEQKAAAEKYLMEIKPSCDFITANLDKRKANRAAEKDSLDNAVKLIKGTPAYQKFESE